MDHREDASGEDKEAVLVAIEAAYELGNTVDTTGMILSVEAQAQAAQQYAANSASAEVSFDAATDMGRSAGAAEDHPAFTSLLPRETVEALTHARKAAGDNQAAREQGTDRLNAEVDRAIAGLVDAGSEELVEGELHSSLILDTLRAAIEAHEDVQAAGQGLPPIWGDVDEYRRDAAALADDLEMITAASDGLCSKRSALRAALRGFALGLQTNIEPAAHLRKSRVKAAEKEDPAKPIRELVLRVAEASLHRHKNGNVNLKKTAEAVQKLIRKTNALACFSERLLEKFGWAPADRFNAREYQSELNRIIGVIREKYGTPRKKKV